MLSVNAVLVDILHIKDSLLEVGRDGAAMVVVSNAGKTSHLLKEEKD